MYEEEPGEDGEQARMDMERDSGEKLPTAKKPIIRQSSLLSYFISRVKETNIKDSCKDSPMDISLSLEQEIPMSQENTDFKIILSKDEAQDSQEHMSQETGESQMLEDAGSKEEKVPMSRHDNCGFGFLKLCQDS